MNEKILTILFLILVLFSFSMGMGGEEFDFEKIGDPPAIFVTPVFRYVGEAEAGIKLNIDFMYHGIALGDVNGDNYDDILVSNMLGPHAYYLNNGDGTFSDRSSTLPNYNYYGHGIVLFDPDNDGDLELVIGNAFYEPNQFFLNDGSGNFTEMNDRLSGRTDGTRGVVALDFDNSGSMDLYLVNFYVANELFSNLGDGTFVEEAMLYNCQDTSDTKEGSQGVTTVDYDNDGYMDIYISRWRMSGSSQRNVLYRNQGKSFVDVAPVLGLNLEDNNGATFSDLDNDGWKDLMICSNRNNLKLRVFKNSRGTFSEVTDIANIQTGYASGASAVTADLDNDGLEDIIVPGHYSTTKIYFNNNGFQFTRMAVGIEEYLEDSRSVAVFDYDNDGDVDIVMAGKRATGARLYQNMLNPNEMSGANYLQLVVMSPSGSYGAFGTKLYLYSNRWATGNPVKYKEVKSAEAYLCQSTPVTHFGLGGTQQVSMKVKFLTGEEKFLLDIHANNKYYAGFLPDITINSTRVVQEESFLFEGPRYLRFDFSPLTQVDTLKIFVKMNGIWSFKEERQIINSLDNLMVEVDDNAEEYALQYEYSNNGKNYVSFATFYTPQ
ncbi:MAG: CRTAC1 family protein [Candidatus Aminicenantes bacterium]|nr:MAG: CRTAC1 family protein [Candidatus Aminicenantes bacterium]